MKTLLLCACLLAVHGGDREKGLKHYREGRYAEAAAAFRAAIESEGDSADLQFNLALASWRAGDLAAAETAVEKYAAMAGDARTELHAGLLGALRHEEAKLLEARADALIAGSGQPAVAPNVAPNAAPNAAPEDPMPLLEHALQKAVQSQDYFLRGVKAKPAPELLRNVERSLRTMEEIEKKIEELKKQRKEQEDEKKDGEKKPDDKNEQKKDEKKDGDKKPDDKSEPDKDQKKQDEKPDEKQGEKQQQPEGKGEEKPEPKAGEPQEQKGDEQKPQPKADESKSGEKPPSEQPEPKPGEEQKARTDAPGEAAEGKELTPEQTQRLMEQLGDLDAKLKSFRARAKTGRRPVERDW